LPDVPVDTQVKDNVKTICQEIKNKIKSEKRKLSYNIEDKITEANDNSIDNLVNILFTDIQDIDILK